MNIGQVVLLAGLFALAGCDSHRTVINDDGGQGVQDGSPGDVARRWDGKGAPDRRVVPDKAQKDSCLPLPSKQVQGSYKGTWKGVINCPSLGGKSSISGTMQFSLSPAASPESFSVKGSMSGTALGTMPFTSSITGTMGCIQLVASLPDIAVGVGGATLKGKGSMKGTFAVNKGTRLFRAGTWQGKENSNLCTASGSWLASHN